MRTLNNVNCKETGKYCYSSEAKATRALNRYDEIERIYLCSSCNNWHTTSMDSEISTSFGYDVNPKKEKCSKKIIRKRLNELLKIIK
jgi:hypothetical protein